MNKRVIFLESFGWLAVGGFVGYFMTQKIGSLEYRTTQRYILIIITSLAILIDRSYLSLWYDMVLFVVGFVFIFWII